MPIVSYKGEGIARVGIGEAWSEGESRSLEQWEAEYLLRAFPACFEQEGRRSVLDLSISQLKAEIESGVFDLELAELLAAEIEGQNRSGALRVIKARIEAV